MHRGENFFCIQFALIHFSNENLDLVGIPKRTVIDEHIVDAENCAITCNGNLAIKYISGNDPSLPNSILIINKTSKDKST